MEKEQENKRREKKFVGKKQKTIKKRRGPSSLSCEKKIRFKLSLYIIIRDFSKGKNK